jgi:metal-responsive CopG/Arc/MetJ family transcriptional regulator
MTNEAVKVTISVPHDLVAVADEVAREKNISRSKVIASCLQNLALERLHQEMAEGYRALAEENLMFAEKCLPLANEVLPQGNDHL